MGASKAEEYIAAYRASDITSGKKSQLMERLDLLSSSSDAAAPSAAVVLPEMPAEAIEAKKRGNAHFQAKELDGSIYVDYKSMKRAIKQGCTEEAFQELYDVEVMRRYFFSLVL